MLPPKLKECLQDRLSKLETGITLLRDLFYGERLAQILCPPWKLGIFRVDLKKSSKISEYILRPTRSQADQSACKKPALRPFSVLNIPAHGAFLRPTEEP
jgi:hypothetical protein